MVESRVRVKSSGKRLSGGRMRGTFYLSLTCQDLRGMALLRGGNEIEGTLDVGVGRISVSAFKGK